MEFKQRKPDFLMYVAMVVKKTESSILLPSVLFQKNEKREYSLHSYPKIATASSKSLKLGVI